MRRSSLWVSFSEIEQVRWNRGGAKQAQYFTSFHGKQNKNCELGTGLFIYKIRTTSLKRVELNLGRGHPVVFEVHPPTPRRYTTHSGCVFYSPLSGFSLLVYEVT